MVIKKSEGVTRTERLLTDLCERTFLKLWSYPNPFNENQDELCDLLAVFDKHIFIFFDRENLTLDNKDKDPLINWNRWQKKVIKAQIKTANGAERYIRKNRKIFLDKDLKTPFPLEINPEEFTIHKIVVAHGAKAACENFSTDNVYGSLAISYGDKTSDFPFPFFVQLEKDNPIHVLDSHNLQIILSELDTFYDFTAYLDAKIEAIKKYDALTYCGEEDLLAHYFMNFNESKNQHYIGATEDNINMLVIGEGEWKSFVQRQEYKDKKAADEQSYFWDEIIQKTCNFTLEGTILGDHSPLDGKSAIHEMAKEPRFHRRTLSEAMIQAIKTFPESSSKLVRKMSFLPSYHDEKGYVFLQLKAVGLSDTYEEYREKRQSILQIACGSAKNKFNHLKTIVGIAIDAPKFTKKNSEDFILMECSEWTDENKKHYENLNLDWNFFKTSNLTMHKKTVTEFPQKTNDKNRRKKIGRNEPCICGSGKKYKKCCINIPLKYH